MTRGLLEHLNHELRSPMTVIVGMADLLMIAADGEPKRLLQSVKQAADVMLRMLDETIDFSRLEAGVAQLARDEFAVSEVVRRAVASLAKGAAPLKLETAIEAGVPERLLGDADRLRQIIEALVRSAAKLRPGPGYELQVLADHPATGIVLHFVLGNRAAAAEPRQSLETVLTQTEGEILRLADFAHRGFFGSGLGLPVAAGLSELMQGELWMSSKSDAETVFRFTAPFEPASGRSPDDFLAAIEDRLASHPEPASSRNILLAEDTETNREFLRTALEQRGHQVVSVADGQAALRAFHSSTTERFDLILLDVEMPILDGREAAAALRKLQKFIARPVPIIALTAHQTAGDPEFAAGGLFDAALTKPCDLPHLYALIESLAVGDVPACPSSTQNHSQPANQRIDYRGTLRRLGGNEQLFYDLQRFFLEDISGALDKLRRALDQRNGEGIERAAHSLKGLVVNFGAAEATRLASELQSIGRERDLRRAPAVFERLASEVHLLRQELETVRTLPALD